MLIDCFLDLLDFIKHIRFLWLFDWICQVFDPLFSFSFFFSISVNTVDYEGTFCQGVYGDGSNSKQSDSPLDGTNSGQFVYYTNYNEYTVDFVMNSNNVSLSSLFYKHSRPKPSWRVFVYKAVQQKMMLFVIMNILYFFDSPNSLLPHRTRN